MLSEIPKEFALLALAAAIAFAVILFLYALGLRLASVAHSREEHHVRQIWWPLFSEAAIRGRISGITLPRRNIFQSRTILLREWCRFRSTIRGDCCNHLDQFAIDIGLSSVAEKMLLRQSVSHKLLAIQALGLLKHRSSWSRIAVCIDDPNIAVSITAASALVAIDAKPAVRIVLPKIAQRRNWPRAQLGRILNAAGQEVVSKPLCRLIEKANSEVVVHLLKFYEAADINDVDSLAAHLLISRSDPSVLAAALKSVRGHLPATIIKRCARHKVWFVRMQAARLLGRFGRREDYSLLEPLLCDAEWWVRYRAAQAITRLPFLGPNALRKLRDRQQDRFARQIMAQALAEAGLQ